MLRDFFWKNLKFKLEGLGWGNFKILKIKIEVLKLKFCSLQIWLYGHASEPWGAQLDPSIKKKTRFQMKKIYHI